MYIKKGCLKNGVSKWGSSYMSREALVLLLLLVFGKRREEILSVVTGDVLLELIDALRHQWRLFERKTFRLTPT